MTTIRLWRRSLGRVDVLDVEEYLRGVVPAEMPASWPEQALKAQAVAARTYSLAATAAPRHAAAGADLCDTAQCQAWRECTYATTDAAVADTKGETWVGDGAYVSRCGRDGCPACEARARERGLADVAAAGYGGHAWPGRMCQNGARAMAAEGRTYREILAWYYSPRATRVAAAGAGEGREGEVPGCDDVADANGGPPVTALEVDAAIVASVVGGSMAGGGTDVVEMAAAYGDYPRPADDTGAGVHGGANAYQPLGDNDGNVPSMLDEMYAMGLRWLKLLDVDGSSYNACKLVLAGSDAQGRPRMMPVLRLYRERPYPGCRLSAKHRAVLPQLTALGVRYFERGNEPNLVGEWQAGRWPERWGDATYDALVVDWLADARDIVACGGYPAIDACSPGGDVDDITFLSRWLEALARAGLPSWMGGRAWLAVHNAGLNHPLDYPDDAVNQADHPGQTIHTHYAPGEGGHAGGSPTGASNCIRKWEAVHQLAIDVAGLDLPVLCTEGGYWPGNAADSRYPALTEQAASDLQAAALHAMATAPAYLLAMMPWLWFNRLGANRHEGFENDAWKRLPGFGNCPAGARAERPLVAALRAEPCRARSMAAGAGDVEKALGDAIQADVVPLVPSNAFATDGLARGWLPASDEAYKRLADGNTYCVQAWRSAADPGTQHVVYAKVVAGTPWWDARTWFVRPN